MSSIDKLRFPVGHYISEKNQKPETLQKYIVKIESLPSELHNLVSGISPQDALKTYRPDGWNINQLVNHLADSHLNSFTRYKLALTEDNPQIKPYLESKWAEMEDANSDFKSSLLILEGLHARWAKLLKGLSTEQLARTFYHPESKKSLDLFYTTGMYAWHGEHHLAHIKIALGTKLI